MLKHENAHTILNVTLNIMLYTGMFMGVIFLVITFKDLLTGSNLHTSFNLPVAIELKTQSYTYKVNEVGFPTQFPSRWAQFAFSLGVFGVFAFGLLVLYRAREFFSHLLHDPFDPRNAADLRTATRAALWIQVLSIILQIAAWLYWRFIPLTTPLTKALQDVPAVNVNVKGGMHLTLPFGDHLTVFGLDIRPLLLAATFAVLATAFQRGHDLREEERRLHREAQNLRQEQELTI